MAYTGPSIVDYLKSIGQDSSFTARKKLAEQLGITGYTGTAQQNTQMLNMLRNSQNTATQAKTATQPVVQPATQPVVQQSNKTQPSITPVTETTATTPQNAAITALDNISSERKQVNELVQKLIDSFNTSWNPSTDTGYQAAKSQLESAADRAYRNVMAGYLGNQSGNFNSAALQIAAGAQNNILSQLPFLQAEYEDKFNANRRQNISDTSDLVNILLGLEDRDIAAADKELQGQIETIGQYYNDFQAEINRREAINPNDPLIPYLKAARAQKIAQMKEDEKTENEKAISRAFEIWQVLGYATPEIAAILGIPEGAKTAEYADMLADNARADRNLSSSKKQSSGLGTDFGIALQTMLASGNPMKWLEDNADVFTSSEYKELYNYAKNAGLRYDALFDQATADNKASYQYLKDIYVNGKNPYGGDSQYKDNPEAALNNMRTDSKTHKKLLGPLYVVLEQELEQAVEDKKKNSKAKSEFDVYLNQQ